MQFATDKEYQACARDVLARYSAAGQQIEVRSEGITKFRATFPLATYALNQVYAALVLADTRWACLPVANIRVAYEHAVTAQWVLFTDGAEDLLIGSTSRASRLVIDMIADHAAVPDELRTGYGRVGDPPMPSMEDRCKSLDGGNGTLYFYYRVLSEAVHPSVATLIQHLTFDGKRDLTGVKVGADGEPPPDTWMICAVAALSAAFVIESQRDGQPRLPDLVSMVDKIGLPPPDLRTARRNS